MPFTNAWNTAFGNSPADTDQRKYGAQEIRKHKDAITERMQKDHEFGEEIIASGIDDQTDSGYHKRITFLQTTVAKPDTAGYTEVGAETTGLYQFEESDAKRPVAPAVNCDAKNLRITIPTVDTVRIRADWIKFVSITGTCRIVANIDVTLTLSNASHRVGLETASTMYQIWLDSDLTGLFQPDIASTADGTTAGYIDDSAHTLKTLGAKAGDWVFNTTDNTDTKITTTPSADGANVAIDDDIMTSGEDYTVHVLQPDGLGTYTANVGAVYNDSGSDLYGDTILGTDATLPQTSLVAAGGAGLYTAISLLAVPITAKSVILEVYPYNTAGANATAYLASDTSGNGRAQIAIAATGATAVDNLQQVEIVITKPGKIYYYVASGLINISATRYRK